MQPRLRAFTLIEMTVVLLILALIAAVATVRLQGPMHVARMRDVIDRIAAFDQQTRTLAVEQDRAVRIVVDQPSGTFTRKDASEDERLGGGLTLPEDYRIVRMRLGEETFADQSVELTCSRLGLTRSYALCVLGPNGQSRWLFISGLTGDACTFESEDAVDATLSQTTPGHHAR